MQVTARDIERIPAGNVRVPRAEFRAVWLAAEAALAAQAEDPSRGHVWYELGVATTCRWMAVAVVPGLRGRGSEPAHAPVSSRSSAAHEESLEYETFAAERLAGRHPAWLENRPGWIEGVLATLQWAWRGTAGPPIDVRPADVG